MTNTPYSASGAMPKSGLGQFDTGPRIVKLETFCTHIVGFIRVTTEDGAYGWGQFSTYNADITVQVFHRQIAPWALGRGMDALENIIAEIPEREHKYPGTYLMRAMAGLDTAMWDWRGRMLGKPVAALLGGSAGKIRTYASSMRRDISAADDAQRMVHLRDAYGFDAVKVRVGAECGNDIDEWPGRTEEIIPIMRHTLGPDVSLLVDGNSGFSPARAIEVGQMLEDHGFEHFEEPCPYWRMEETAEVTAALNLDVAGGEQDWDIENWRRMISLGAVDIIQPDILYIGGITRALQVAQMGAVAGLTCTPHCANLSMITLFTMHLMRAIPNAGRYLEFSIEGADYYPWQEGLFTSDPYNIVDGHACVSDKPGWGVEISHDWLSKSIYQISDLGA